MLTAAHVSLACPKPHITWLKSPRLESLVALHSLFKELQPQARPSGASDTEQLLLPLQLHRGVPRCSRHRLVHADALRQGILGPF